MNQNVADIAITKEQIAGLPLESFNGSIHVVETPEQEAEAFKYLKRCKMLGFDTETRPSFRKGHPNTVALIQISSEKRCYLFRLNKLGFTQALIDFMQDPNTIKIGLSLRDDFLVMHKVKEFEPCGFIDLQEVVKHYMIHDLSLQKIYAIIFGRRISKSQRLSNWEADTLSRSQQVYASIDAWACLRIYRYLTSGKFNPYKSPYHIDLNQSTNQ